jgi:cytochrome P450
VVASCRCLADDRAPTATRTDDDALLATCVTRIFAGHETTPNIVGDCLAVR